MERKRILILCGGRFALPALQVLALEKYLCAVGIGKAEKQLAGELREECERTGLPFRSFDIPADVTELSSWIEEVNPDYVFSISFPFLIPVEALNYGPEKFINFHPGPLPGYRGPMPIFEVLRYGEKETAISVHFMNEEFDEGPLILQEHVPIEKNDTYGSLAVKLSERTAYTALNVAQMLEFASIIPSEPQPPYGRYFEKPESRDTTIRWNTMAAEEILRLIRACNPWRQGADAFLAGENIQLVSAALSPVTHQAPPGSVIGYSEEQGLTIACIENRAIDVQILSCEHGIVTAANFIFFRKSTIGKLIQKMHPIFAQQLQDAD